MNKSKGLPTFFRQGRFWRIFGMILSLGLLMYLVRAQGWDVFLDAMRSLPPQSFWLALGLILISRVFVSLRWFVLLRSAGTGMSFGQCLRLVFMGLFSSNFLPSTVGGDFVRAAGAVYLRINTGLIAASLVVDRLVGMAGMALLLPAGLAVIASAPAGSAWQQLPSVLDAGVVSVSRLGWLKSRLVNFVRSMLQSSVYWLKHPGSLGLAFLFTFGHMLATYLSIYELLLGMGHPVSLFSIAGLWSFSYFFSLAPFSINGLGLQEVSIAYLYSHFGGVPMENGLALAVLMRMLLLIASLPGAVFLPGLRRPPAVQADEQG